AEFDQKRAFSFPCFCSRKFNMSSTNCKFTGQDFIFPPLCISNHALPGCFRCLLKCKLMVGRVCRLQAKNFYSCPCIFKKEKPCMDYPGIVEHQHGILRQMVRQVTE